MNKHSIKWNIKKYRYFVRCNMPGCAEIELQAIRGKIKRRNIK